MGKPSPALVRGPPLAPASETCGEGLREVRGGGRGDPTPGVRTQHPGRLRGAGGGCAGFEALGAAARTVFPSAGDLGGERERASALEGLWERVGEEVLGSGTPGPG